MKRTIKRITHRLHDIALAFVLIIAAMCYGMNGAEFVSEEEGEK
jgi:hypothetical protein